MVCACVCCCVLLWWLGIIKVAEVWKGAIGLQFAEQAA